MNNKRPKNTFCGQLNRREYLHQMGGGFSSLAMAGLLAKDGFIQSQAVAADGKTPWANPLAPKDSPLPAKAKNVIFLFMYGGPSHMDTFEYKPELYPLDGKTIKVKTFGRGGKRTVAGWWARSGSSSSTANAANMSVTCSRTSAGTWTRFRSSTR